MGLKVIGLGLPKPLFNGSLNTNQPGPKLVFSQFTHTTNTSVAQVIDVINFATSITQFNKQLDGVKNVFVGQNGRTKNIFAAKPTVELHAADLGEVVRIFAEEEPIKKRLYGVFRGGLTGTHHAINSNPSRER
ncbi:MAG: hypothetical protein RL424_810, partial [Pseudomonadota bacterium]